MSGRLKQTYLRLKEDSGKLSFGGNQAWMGTKRLQGHGCGAVACMDVATYLKECDNPSVKGEYIALLELFQKQYIPIFPKIGTLGIIMAVGLNRYFRKNDMKYRAYWGLSYKKIWRRMDQMLNNDIPVILCIGSNFPNPRRGYKLPLYVRKGGEFLPASAVAEHFVVATAVDGDWIQISSWGKVYYINKIEYDSYVEFHSSKFLNNIMVIRKK